MVQGLSVQHAAQLRGFIVALTPDLGQVGDVFQETFLRRPAPVRHARVHYAVQP